MKKFCNVFMFVLALSVFGAVAANADNNGSGSCQAPDSAGTPDSNHKDVTIITNGTKPADQAGTAR